MIGESLIMHETQTKKNETDIVVYPESILYPTNITTGRWTISNG